MSTFELTTTTTATYREGWGVDVTPFWAGMDDDSVAEGIESIEVFVVRITREACELVGGAWCVRAITDTAASDPVWVPVENFQELDDLQTDDSHDLRTRWFATEGEARTHAQVVRERWADPAPWESFVVLS